MDKFVCPRWWDNMEYRNLTLLQLHEALLKGDINPLELTKQVLKDAKADDNNAFEYISEKEAFEAVDALKDKDKNNLMWGIPFVIKDNFSTKDIPTTASSNILNGYKPVFDSEVYERLIKAGGIPIGKTTMDELAMGGRGVTGHRGTTFNPYDKTHKRMVGGSSCGSAAIAAAGIVPLAIGSDTGDSVRKPASYAGLVGFKPTWGRISRFGLIPFATSLDHVAYFTRSVKDSAMTLSLLAGRDDKDMTSSDRPVENYLDNISNNVKGVRLAIINEVFDSINDKKVKELFLKTVDALKERGAIINYVSLDIRLCKALFPTYFIISSAEATSNSANLDGIKFGPRYQGDTYEEVMNKARTNGISELIRRRFIIGSYSLLSENQEDTFLRAQKCRRLIVNAINEILKDNDVIYLPASPSTAPLFDEQTDRFSDEYLIADNYLVFGNFAGLPSLTLPMGFIDELPIGVNITGRAFEEQMVLNCSLAVEEMTGLENLYVGRKQ